LAAGGGKKENRKKVKINVAKFKERVMVYSTSEGNSSPSDNETKDTTMTNIEAQKAGVQGFKDGRKCAPALNNKFIAEACASETSTIELLKAYIHGWTVAHLASEAIDAAFPSVSELSRILAA
jgi:hypothetical protein